MKLIALRSFRNPSRTLEIDNHQHPDHVHKGAIFVIGSKAESTLKELKKDEYKLVLELTGAEAIGDANDEELVKRVRAEVAEEKKADARAAGAKLAGEPEKEPAKDPKK